MRTNLTAVLADAVLLRLPIRVYELENRKKPLYGLSGLRLPIRVYESKIDVVKIDGKPVTTPYKGL